MARKQYQNKSGGHGQDNNRKKSQSGQHEGRKPSDNTRNSQPGNGEADDFDSVLPSYGAFLKDMQYEDDWAGDEWDDDMPIEKKVAAQRTEKAKAQKKKQQEKKKAASQPKQEKKPQTQTKSPRHEDEHLFDDEDDRGLILDELDSVGGKKAAPTRQKNRNDDRNAKRADAKKAAVPDQRQNQKPKSRETAAEANKPKTRRDIVTDTKPVSVSYDEPAVSKGGGVSLRIDVSRNVSSGIPSRRKRAATATAVAKTEQQQQPERTSPKVSGDHRNAKGKPVEAKSDDAVTQSPKKQYEKHREKTEASIPQSQRAATQQTETSKKQAAGLPQKTSGDNKKKTGSPVSENVVKNAAHESPKAERSPKQPEKQALKQVDKIPAKKTAKPETEPSEKPSKDRRKNDRKPQRAEVESHDLKTKVEGKGKPSGFGNLKLSKTMLESLKAANYHEPSPVQAGVIPEVLAGRDVMGQARTGTGKTAAFVIPILEGLDDIDLGDEPVALVLVPTRELAVQVRDEADKLAKDRKTRTIACYGGKPIGQQIAKLKQGIDIIVGTPGRVLDLSRRGALKLDSLVWVVLDEADRMLDIGFRPDIEKILRLTPSDRQTLLLSATLPTEVVKLAERYMRDPKVIDFSDKQMAVETIEQYYISIDRDRKLEGLICLIKEQNPKQAIVFCRTKRGADRVKRQLEDTFDSLESLHGDMAQPVRDRVMAKFRAGKLQILVATDVVGRGIDISGISHIINYDIPAFCDDYVHRVGRTGRMGREGTAFTFVTAEEGQELTRIEMRINQMLKRAELKNFEAVSQIVPQEPEPPKPVFGKSTHRVRRAL